MQKHTHQKKTNIHSAFAWSSSQDDKSNSEQGKNDRQNEEKSSYAKRWKRNV